MANVTAAYELDLGYFDPEYSEKDAQFIKALVALSIDELNGKTSLEGCAITLTCSAYVEGLIEARLTADPYDSSPAEGGWTELDEVEVHKDGKLIDFDVELPGWLTDSIQEYLYEAWEQTKDDI